MTDTFFKNSVGRLLASALLLLASMVSKAEEYRQMFSGYGNNSTVYIFADMPETNPQITLQNPPYGYGFIMPTWNDNFKDTYPGYIYGNSISENSNIAKLYSNGQAGYPVYLVYTLYGRTRLNLWAGTANNNYIYCHHLNVEVIATSLEKFKSYNSLQGQTKLRCKEGLIVTYKDDQQAFIQTNRNDMNAVGLHIVLKDEKYRNCFNNLKVGDILYGELSGKMTRSGDGNGTSGTNYGCELEFIYYNERRDWNNGDLHNQPLPLTEVDIRKLEEHQTTGQYKWDLDGCRVLLRGFQSADNQQLGSNGYMKSTGFSVIDATNSLTVGGKSLACNMFSDQNNMMVSQRVDMDAICYPVWQADRVGSSNYSRIAFYLPNQDDVYGLMKIYRHGYITFALDQPFQLPTTETPSGTDSNNAMVEYASTIGNVSNGLHFSRTYTRGGGHAIPKDEAVLVKAADDIQYTGNAAILRFHFAKSDLQPLPYHDAGQGANLLHWGEPGKMTSLGKADDDSQCKFYHLAADDYTDITSPVNFYYATGCPNGEPFTMPSTNRTSTFLAVPKTYALSAKSIIRLNEFYDATTGVSNATTFSPQSGTVTKYYSISGTVLAKPQKGLNIIKSSDGKTKKVMKY